MRRFSCDEARTHLSDALASEIGRPEANVLEAHLLECDPCRSLAELFLWQDRVLTELAGQARIETLMSKVREGLLNLDQVSFEEETRSRWSLTISPRWVAAAAAFILALVAVIFWKPAPSDNRSAQVAPAPAKTDVVKSSEADPAPAPEKVQDETPVVPPVEIPVPAPAVVAEGSKPVSPAPPSPKVADLPKPDPKPAPVKEPAPVIVKNTPKDQVEKPKTLDDAVRGGMAFLKAKAAVFAKDSKSDELLLWTYLQGGVPESDPEFQALLKTVLDKKLERTYNVALAAMVLEDLDRVKYQKRLAQCAQFLLDNQCANGQWGYGEPSMFAEELVVPAPPPKAKNFKVKVTRRRDGLASGDNSNSMYALLGLRACHDANIVLPPESLKLASKWWRDTQSRVSTVKAPAVAPEGWCYSRHDHKPYGSMTAGGVGSLVICDYILNIDWKKDREVASGMEWLGKNFSASYNPGPYEHANMEENSQHQFYYYMYGLERAAILYGTEQIGGNYWFAKGLEVLMGSQRADGSWKSPQGGNELYDTCFAVLFLRKATRGLPDVTTPGAGVPKK